MKTNRIKKLIVIAQIFCFLLIADISIADSKDGNTSFLNWLLEDSGTNSSKTAETNKSESFDYFIDTNNNGIDDRLESRKKEVAAPKPSLVPQTAKESFERSAQELKSSETESMPALRMKSYSDEPPASTPSSIKSSASRSSQTKETNVQKKSTKDRTAPVSKNDSDETKSKRTK